MTENPLSPRRCYLEITPADQQALDLAQAEADAFDAREHRRLNREAARQETVRTRPLRRDEA